MPFLNEQISIVNELLKAGPLKDARFSDGLFAGLANIAQITDSTGTRTMPVVENENHEVTYIGIDDTYPIIIYHKQTSNTYAEAPDSVGDGYNKVRQLCDMQMIVYGKRSALNITASQLEALITTNFPDQLPQSAIKPLRLSSLKVKLVSSNMNALQVFAGEYRGTDHPLGPEDIFFSIRYQLESMYRKGCFNTCDCPAQ